jgi:subtilisin-like proprotein convertase family protein
LAGGPFTPSSVNYTVENVEDFPIDYEVTTATPWLDIANASGTIPANTTVVVGLSMNGVAAGLGNGVYNGLENITNLTNGDGNTFRPVTLEIGRVIYTATSVPQNIPDNNATGISNVINVPDGFCLADVDVDVNISHTSIGQLIVELESPLGTVVRLHNRTGGTADHIVKVYNDDAVPVDGPGLLADFNGRYVGGQWKLKVSDNASGTTGSVQSWALRVVPSGPICAPIAQAQSIVVPVIVTSPINLLGTTATNDPVGIYIISSLPTHGSLTDPNAGLITSVPYTLTSNANTVLYKPTFGYQGPDGFAFRVNDTVLDSADADVNITVGGPQLVFNFNMDTNPGWTTEGQWAYGVPAGLSGDPAGGVTGANVYGYNLSGDYVNILPVYKLTSTGLDCSNVSYVTIMFWRWLGVDRAQYDHE